LFDLSKNLEGVCKQCLADYITNLGPNWKSTPTGRFLLGANAETAAMERDIACSPAEAPVEIVSLDALSQEEVWEPGGVPRKREAALVVKALYDKSGWGARRIHEFLQIAGYDVSLSTVQRRLREMRPG
jgi:hypothetical protein